MQFLRQSTAATVLVGPAVDQTDGVTEVTGLAAGTVDSAGVMKHDGTIATDISGTTTMTHRTDGYYTVTLSTSDTGTAGRLVLFIADEDACLPMRHEYMVLPAAIYDVLVAGSTTLPGAIWDATIASYQNAGSTGEALDTASGTSPTITVNLEDRRPEQYPQGFSRHGNEQDLVAFQSTAGRFEFPLLTQNSLKRDVSGKSLLFNVFELGSSTSAWSVDALIVGTRDHVARVEYAATDVATAGTFAYSLVNSATGELLKRGELVVRSVVRGGA